MAAEAFEDSAGAKQSLWRDVNENINTVHEGYEETEATRVYLCECAISDCRESLELTPSEYERIRADGRRFVVAPADGHVVPEVEQVVAREAAFWIVEKIGENAAIAEHLDPRDGEGAAAG